MNNSTKFSFDDLLTGGMFDPAPVQWVDPRQEIEEYLVLHMPVRDLLGSYGDIEDLTNDNLPLRSLLRRCHRNLRREIKGWSEERVQKELKSIRGEPNDAL